MVGCVTGEDSPCAVVLRLHTLAPNESGFNVFIACCCQLWYHGASYDHMMPCGVQVKHASTCMMDELHCMCTIRVRVHMIHVHAHYVYMQILLTMLIALSMGFLYCDHVCSLP